MDQKRIQRFLSALMAFAMLLSLLPAGVFAAEGDTAVHQFTPAEHVALGADKDVIAEGTTYADGYFTVVGTVTQRVKSGAVYAVEVAKNGAGALEFTVSGTADVTFEASSTGGSNTSVIALVDAQGNVLANQEGVSEVTGTSAVAVTYTGLPSGTYQILSPKSDYGRGYRVMSVTVTETADASGETEPPQETTVPQPTEEPQAATSWDFSAEDFTGEGNAYNGLTWTAGGKNKVYLLANAGTISVPVAGPSEIAVSACYQYSFYFAADTEGSVDQKTGSTSQIDTFTYLYTGEAGTVDITVLGQSYLTGITVTPREPEEAPAEPELNTNLIDVWDFGAEQLDTAIYRNMLDEAEINSWFPDQAPGTSGVPLLAFTSTDGELMFEANGKVNNRLRTTNTNLCRHDSKSLTDANGTVYSGYVYSNSSSTDKVYLAVKAYAGDILTVLVGSNGGNSTIHFQAPSGAEATGVFTSGGATAQSLTFYASETGMYKLYSSDEKLVVARIYRQHTASVSVTGTVTAPESLSGYSLVFTNDQNGSAVTAPVSGGSYTAELKDCYTYSLSLVDANGYVIVSQDSLSIEKGAENVTCDVTVEQVDLVTVTGSITGLSEEALAKAQLEFRAEAIYIPEIAISGSTYSAVLEKGVSYELAVLGVNDYVLVSASTVAYEADAAADIVLEAKPTYPITVVPEGATLEALSQAVFTFTNLNEDGYVYTFTGADAIALRDGTYSVKVSNSEPYVQLLTSNLLVIGAAASKKIPFTDDIRVWDFSSADFTGEGGAYNNLHWTAGTKNKTYLLANAGTVSVPVPGPCKILVSCCYQYSFYFEQETEASVDQKTGSTSKIDTFTYVYTGEAGTVDITVLGQSYLTKIEVVETAPYRQTLTVGASGCDYTTINDALAAVRVMERTEDQIVTISIQPGNYEEMLVIDVPNVHLVNASATPSLGLTNQGVDIDANAVRITSYYGHGYTYYSMGTDCKYDENLLQVNKENGYASFTNPGSGTTNGSYWNATVVITASGFQAQGIIFENSFNQYVSMKAANDVIVPQNSAKEGSVPRAELVYGSTMVQNKKYVERAAALAIANNVSQVYFENCKFIGRQDTLYGGTNVTAAFYGCSIYGACDYIFGGMSAVFAKCDLVFNTSEDGNDVGYITAAQTAAGTHGLLMYNCTVTSTTPGVDTASEYPSKPGYFGRPWAANTGEAVFYNTVIEATDAHWYSSSPSLIHSVGWLSTLSGESALSAEYGTYEYAEGVDNSANRVSWATVLASETLTSGEAISVATFLGDWDPFQDKDMTVVIPTDKVNNNPDTETPEEPETPTEQRIHSLDATADLTAFAQGDKADGDVETFKDYFTVMYSAKNKVDGSKKTFDDGYTATQRLNFGGKTDPANGMINSVKFTTENPATVKIWWVSGGDGRNFAIYSADGTVLAETADASVKNALYISELEIAEAGTYYLGLPQGSNYLFRVDVIEEVPVAAEPQEYILDATADLTAFAQGDKADGDVETFHDFFTVMYSAKNKVDGSKKTFDDGYTATQRLNFGGKTDPANGMINSVKFTVDGAATVKIWWVSGGDGRNFAIYSADGTVLAETADASVKNALYISELEIAEAGTYYLGLPQGSNYLFKVQVTVLGSGGTAKPERADWSQVAEPVITGAATSGGDITVSVTGLVGYDGADELLVTMYDASGKELGTKRSIAEKNEHTITFTADASGQYTFQAALVREGEADKTSAVLTHGFVLPLEAPILSSATSVGKGCVNVVWNAAKEAVSYNVYVDGVLAGNTSELSYTVTGLTVGSKYSFTVEAVRGEDTTLSEALEATVTENAQAVWSFLRYGPSTNDSSNYYEGSINEQGAVTVYSVGGKGKIQPKDSDGLAYYYTAVPADKNFTFRATVTVDEWKYSNGQEGFGLLAMDSLPEHGAATHWTNQYMVMLGKVEYFYDFAQEKVVSDANDNTVKYSMKLGLGVLPKLGITPENYDKVTGMDTETILQVATGITDPLDLTAARQQLVKGNYNIVGNLSNPANDPATIAEITTFILEIQKNNTGYFITYYAEDGTVIGQQKYYGTDALQQLDTENVYVGFFAARNAQATFSNVTLTTIDPAEDAPAEEKPVTYVAPSCLVVSPAVTNDSGYTLSLNANVAGTAIITVDGAVVQEAAVLGGTRCDIPMTVEPGTTKFVVEFHPDPEQDLGEGVELENSNPIITSVNVSYRVDYANQQNLYVAPNGKSTATGYYQDPLDIYTAVAVVRPGQTIVLLEGTYLLTRNVLIARGVDGTAENPIRMIADPNAKTRPVLDFSGAAGAEGITLVGSYWYVKGFDVTNTVNGKAGFHVAGHYNTLDQINAYNNGNTGIQISRYQGSDLHSEWPSNNLILNCTSYNNADAGYEDADGFAAKLTVGEGNVFDGCVAYNNADDGWDLYAKVETGAIGSVTIRNCVAYQNGYVMKNGELVNAGNGNGFKMGGSNIAGGHTLINSYAFFNKAKGFDSNSCPDIHVENSIAYNNESYNVAFYTNITQNTAFSGTGILSFKDSTVKSGLTIGENLKPKGNQAQGDASIWNETNYYWDGSKSVNTAGVEVTAEWFVSLEFKGVLRNEDGTINLQGFLELTDLAVENAGARPAGEASKDPILERDNPFTDVTGGNRFKEAVLWAYYNNITTGKTATTFDAKAEVTRGQFVMFLWKAAGSPEPEAGGQGFSDVTSGNRFYKAVMWAIQEGITVGLKDGSFGLNASCTRGQVLMFLWRYAGKPVVENAANPFSDITENNTYYQAVLWAYSMGITSGNLDGTIGIGSTCIRTHAVTFLYNYLNKK